jgi:hypothetical protein
MTASRLFLHVGQGKTGTSTIQEFLHRNRAGLAARGYLYPRLAGRARHLELSLYGRGPAMVNSVAWPQLPWDDPVALEQLIERELPVQVAESGCQNVVLSDEALYRLENERFRRVVSALEPLADELVFVIYLRRQDEHVVSRYKQTMRDGSALLLSEFIARPQTFANWQYDAILRWMTSTFPRARLVARPYSRAHFPEGGLVQDFLEAVELSDFTGEGTGEQLVRNASLDAYTTEYLRRHNEAHGRADRKLRRRLTRISDGPDLRMEHTEHVELWERLQPSNVRLVREFMPEAEELFLSPPQVSQGITQAQVTAEDLATVERRMARRSAPTVKE